MYLEHINIVGFRGINRLSLSLTQPDQRGVALNDAKVAPGQYQYRVIGGKCLG